MSDEEIGTRALKKYYGYMRKMYPGAFNYTEAQFFTIISKLKGGRNLADGIGLGIRQTDMSDSKVDSAMMNLARNGRGKVPSSYMDFFNYLVYQSTAISYVDASLFVIAESTKDVLKGAQAVGDSIITTGKILNFLLPVILLLFVFFWLNKKSDGKLGSLADKAVKAMK